MKKITLSLFALICLLSFSSAQKIAFFNADKILDNMPEVKTAKAELDAKAKEWQNLVDTKFKQLDQMYQDYVKNQDSYSGEMKKLKQDEIINTEKNAKMFRDSIFGADGEMAKLQAAKFQPVYDTIFAVAKRIGISNGYDYVIENTPDSQWIYLNPDYDITGLIKKELGIKEARERQPNRSPCQPQRPSPLPGRRRPSPLRTFLLPPP